MQPICSGRCDTDETQKGFQHLFSILTRPLRAQVFELEDELSQAHRQMEQQQSEWSSLLEENHTRQMDLAETLWSAVCSRTSSPPLACSCSAAPFIPAPPSPLTSRFYWV